MELPNRVAWEDIQLDMGRHELFVRERPIYLPPAPFRLLHLLMSDPGRVFSKKQIAGHLWTQDVPRQDQYSGSIDVYIHRLREAIEDDPSRPKRLITIRCVGYKLVAAPVGDAVDGWRR